MKMKYSYPILIILFIISCPNIFAQEESDTTRQKTVRLGEIVISVNKTEETKRTISQQVQVITAREIESAQAQTTADLMANTGSVFVQKSQQGGGSPVIRGFEASRIVLVVDGVRMNNLIYRAGHLQNVITLDNAVLDRVEVLFGPASNTYGSDALGGALVFYTKNPLFADEGEKHKVKANAMVRYGSVNNEKTGHVDFNFGGKKLASLTSFTYSDFDDLKGGENQNPFYAGSYGERPHYADRFNNKDSLVKNPDRFEQVFSGYKQHDLLQKLSLKQGEHITHGLNIQYSNSNDVPRYDRLTDPSSSGNGLASAEWYYGPQKRLLTAYDLNIKNPSATFQSIHGGVNYQKIRESRHNRNFGSLYRNDRVEDVTVFGADLDLQRNLKSHIIRLGAEMQLNDLVSTAKKVNIETDTSGRLSTRYPDGDNTMNNAAVYLSHTWQINEETTINDGFRIGISNLRSTLVDTTDFPLPYSEIVQKMTVYSGSVGIINSPSPNSKLSLLVSTGFRVPNVDDMSKIFDPGAGRVVVPNPDLKPEKTISYELGITNIFNDKTLWENTIYYTDFRDAIVTDTFRLNGEDSIYYDGTLSRVMANQNKGKAFIYGFSSSLRSQCNENFLLALMINYTYGRIKTDSINYPLDHIPPFMARLLLGYTHKKFSADFFINYNGWKRLKNYGGGEDNPQYATPEGMPAWFTVNLHASYKVHKHITLQAGVDNIFDTQYRPFASGINGAGRNVFATLRFHY